MCKEPQRASVKVITAIPPSVSIMLDSLVLEPLETRRKLSRLCMMYKIIHGLVDLNMHNYSTLYTSLPHTQLKKQLHDLLERVLNTKGKSFIATNNFRIFWANDKTSTKYTYFSCRELGLAIDFLIDNIYVRFGSSVFRQVIGIPMGTNSAPLLADLFLHTS